MAATNISSMYTSVFILDGVPDLESSHLLISIPLFIMFITSVLGNLLLLLLIMMEPRLHSPMYYFLYALFLTDLIVSNSIGFKTFCILWLNQKEIPFISCYIQMFFIHCFSSVESGVLMAMAFDRYMAICSPLHYASTLTNALIVKIVFGLVIRSTVIVIPCSWMASRLPYCQSHHIPHTYCDHMAVVHLACTDITINSAYGLTAVVLVIMFDMSSIALSYVFILRAVLRLSTKKAKSKAFGTCTSHICIIVIVYTLGLFTFVTYRIGHIAPYIHVIMANLYLLIPPTLNPIIYGVKTKEIRTAALNLFTLTAL
ncbi:olfactory receptor 52N2-like [Dendropsophus ebraccatus]|uniref:olfactory receptor 52N2-like n=1 Tax=Dendropsophus ebraccatus TaxID=150705 RepID=UPI003831E329